MPIKRKLLLALCIIAVLIAGGILLTNFYFRDYNEQKENDLQQLAIGNYNAIFCSMYPIDNFSQDDFITYRGLNTLKFETVLQNTSDLDEYLATAFASDNRIETIYLGLDPAEIWSSSLRNTGLLNRTVSKDILAHASAHPEVTFEVMLPFPSLEYWKAKSEAEIEGILNAYQTVVSSLKTQSNIVVFYFGDEQWLIANPDNYSDLMTTNSLVSKKMFLYTFCDHKFQITAEDASMHFDTLKSYISQEKAFPTEYPNLSSWDVVFFGDSIIGNYEGSSSVPGAITGLTDAHTYNCAKGGSQATVSPKGGWSCPVAANYFIAQDVSVIPEDGPFLPSMKAYLQEDHTNRKLCFVMNFGLNDYFAGMPVDNSENPYDTSTYAGAMRDGISRLQDAYPDAQILVMAPTFTTLFTNGTEIMSEAGSPLREYVDAAVQVANDMNVLCMDNYTDLGIDIDNANIYLEDGCHLNERGRFLLAQKIIEQISQ